jgi:hypothetical protein
MTTQKLCAEVSLVAGAPQEYKEYHVETLKRGLVNELVDRIKTTREFNAYTPPQKRHIYTVEIIEEWRDDVGPMGEPVRVCRMKCNLGIVEQVTVTPNELSFKPLKKLTLRELFTGEVQR